MSTKSFFIYPLEVIYSHLPPSIRYGSVFRNTYSLLQESLNWRRADFDEYQFRQMLRVVEYAYHHVPYYRKLFDEHELHLNSFKDLEDFKKIPILTRENIVDYLNEMTSTVMPGKYGSLVTTGGSSGAPLSFYVQRNFTYNRELAFNWFYWNRMNISYKDKLGILRGVNLKNTSSIFEKKAKTNAIILNSYQLSESNYPKFIDAIKTQGLDYIRAYPSTIVLLAKYIVENNISMKLKAVLTSSENFYDRDRAIIEKAFNCKAFDLYGVSECVVHINQCERCDIYHVDPLYGYTEFLDIEDDNKNIKQIVSTSFNNFYMPLIRYKTGDIAECSDKKCICGFEHLTVKSILGRDGEYVISKSKRILTLTALVFAQHFKAFDRMLDMQIFQDKIGFITVRVVPKPSFTSDDEKEILSKMITAADNDLDVQIEITEAVERTPRGKKLFLIQKLDVNQIK